MRTQPPRRRAFRRTLTTALICCTAALSLTTGPANADPQPTASELPPQEPGVTLRVFDVQIPLDELCTLKPGQTPNIDKLEPDIDFSTAEDFGFESNFVSQVTANINVPQDGTYTFRLTSDDGSQLLIDDQLVIDHDGLHGAEPKDGTVELTAGYHSLRIDHFERGGGQQVTLAWQPPGASEFALVPNSVLSTEADVVRVTAPGRKECEGAFDSPGDGLPLTGVHPDYDLTDLRPAGFEPQITAMDWLPDNRLAVTTWGGSQATAGEVYLLDHVTGATGPDKVTTKKIASGLKEPMGIKYVDGKLYVSQKHELTELTDTNGDDVIDDTRTVATWPYGGNFHEFAFGLLYRDGFFYLNLSVAINYGGATTDPQPAANRGTTIKVNRKTGKVSYIAGGLRTPNGIGFGPQGDLFVTDNQGGWLPASKLVRIKQDRFFNHYTNPDGPFDANPVTQPVLWLPQNEIANSPSTPIYVTKGRYAGQMLFGDVTYGGLQRAYLEKVKGEYQGAVFRHTQGLEAGVTRISRGPDGAIYAGGLGAGGNWGQEGKLTYGLQKLTSNGGNAFDILSMRAVDGGFELTYTQPLSQETADKLADRYRVKQWRYVPTPAYGGPKVDEETLTVRSASLSRDGKKVRLSIAGLKPGHVVHVRSPRPFSSASGESLWSTEAWYTLNNLTSAHPRTTLYEAEEAALSGGAGTNTDHGGFSGASFVDRYGAQGATTTFTVDVPEDGSYDVGLRYSNGPNPFSGTKAISVAVNGAKVGQTRLLSTGDWETWSTQAEKLTLRAGTNTIAYRNDPGDDGHVNLDLITVHKSGERVTLFDGEDRSLWQHTSGRAAQWPLLADGGMEVCCGDLRTKTAYRDFRLHVEFRLPNLPPDVTGQDRANSGVYLQDRYEIQILDSYGDTDLANNEAASIYSRKAADVNAALAPETWQSYDIVFHAARYNDAGDKTADARVTMMWNGKTVHDDVAITSPTGGGAPETAMAGAIRLQDHGNKVRYRNIWIEPLD
ncbi:large, multifunctional secreted protein [Streptomyces davaonensis JCM 4913]|uniref:Large, multifunctional secreted protein n=1 Tax=Streptomyces davaonensis (strain DSM 101723 / JCM 4913 / KCC S-0913 / 768) TaxID=1214101 RepID=K4QWX1_STRDJ|nr:family 16 glycoside hydrolase [Streptomyces davaonensis]CCK24864.1 large, multifunctional secreted protein [Streptomyces davaonensis JCM 4913]